jgi:hypothetical protein
MRDRKKDTAFMRSVRLSIIFFSFFSVSAGLVTSALGNELYVNKWKRFAVAYHNPSFSGNPFDLAFHGVFTHQASGRTLKQLGFYAGSNIWKIYFMPDRTGPWTFTTESPDADLDNKTGSFICLPSALPGRLFAEGNRWKLEDGNFDAPIMIPVREWFKRTPTANGVGHFIQWAKDKVGARLIGTTLVYFTHATDAVPYREEFNIPMWDRLNSHFDALRDAGRGHYILL